MNRPTKADRLKVEDAARKAIGRMYSCSPVRGNITVGDAGAIHEFDIYTENTVIGGVSTGTFKTSRQNRNTGSCDRACSELLWLSLWPGHESRVHVLTDKALAEWLVARHFKGVVFPRSITVYHYSCADDTLHQIGVLGGAARKSATQI